MPKIHLTQQFADNPPIAKNKTKMDYFDIGRSQAESCKQIRSATLIGYDPNAQVDKNRDMPTLKEFIDTRYPFGRCA